MTLGTVGWNEVDDHAKWVIAGNYVCFGDMNRMESQWKRGGAFYCLSSVSLVMAMNQLVVSHDSC